MPRPPTAPPRGRARRVLAMAGIALALAGTACESDTERDAAATTVPTAATVPDADPGSGDDGLVRPAPADLDGSVVPDARSLGTTVSVASVRAVDFDRFTFPASTCAHVIDHAPSGGYRLDAGVLTSDGDDGIEPFRVQLHAARSFGDLDGDGVDEAALVLDCDRGGGPVPVGWIYTATGGRARPLARLELDGDSLPLPGVLDTALVDLRIAGGTVVSTWDVYLDGDALCCPARLATVTWTWNGSALAPGAPAVTDRPARR